MQSASIDPIRAHGVSYLRAHARRTLKLFLIELHREKRRSHRYGVEAIVHARSRKAAERHLAGRFTGHAIARVTRLPNVTKHFIVADLFL